MGSERAFLTREEAEAAAKGSDTVEARGVAFVVISSKRSTDADAADAAPKSKSSRARKSK